MINIDIWIAITSIGITLIGLVITLVSFIWKTATIYGNVKYQIRCNTEDINRMGNTLRADIQRKNYIIVASLSDIQEFLHTKHDYRIPTWKLRDFENTDNN